MKMAEVLSSKVCETVGCKNEARLQCPTCLKLGITGSYFCSQDCFKGSWDVHKKLHKQTKGSTQNGVTENYNPWPSYIFTGKLRPYPVGAKRDVPAHILRPDYADHPEGFPVSERALRGTTNIEMLSDEDQELLRTASRLGREVLDEAAKAVAVGVTTDELDRICHEACIERECYPSPLNYYNFPKSCCTSVNEVICHGIPDQRKLRDGDIVNIDVSTYYRGFHGDLNETLFVGKVDERARNLVQVTYECLAKAIAAADGSIVALKMLTHLPVYSLRERDLKGLNILSQNILGRANVHETGPQNILLFHTTPSVPHYAKNKAIGVMKPGHSFTIEPMINEGTWRDQTWPDNWTSVTTDGKLSAQFEHTLLVTETGCDVLTKRFDRDGQPYFMDSL